jgi:hypothetical protein
VYGTSAWAGKDGNSDTVPHTHLGHVGAKRSELEVRWHDCAVSRGRASARRCAPTHFAQCGEPYPVGLSGRVRHRHENAQFDLDLVTSSASEYFGLAPATITRLSDALCARALCGHYLIEPTHPLTSTLSLPLAWFMMNSPTVLVKGFLGAIPNIEGMMGISGRIPPP